MQQMMAFFQICYLVFFVMANKFYFIVGTMAILIFRARQLYFLEHGKFIIQAMIALLQVAWQQSFSPSLHEAQNENFKFLPGFHDFLKNMAFFVLRKNYQSHGNFWVCKLFFYYTRCQLYIFKCIWTLQKKIITWQFPEKKIK